MKLSIKQGNEFEKFVFNLLRAEARKEGMPIFSNSEFGRDFSFDAVAPEGLIGLPGPCVIEVKFSANPAILARVIERAFRTEQNFASILFVTNQPTSKIGRTQKIINTIYNDIVVRILGKEDIENIASRNPEVVFSYNKKYLGDAVESLELLDSSEITKQNLAALKSAYMEDQLVLFLGAGVSLSAKLPTWENLLDRLSVSIIETNPAFKSLMADKKSLIDYFKSEIPASPIITARILRDSLGDDFPEYVRKALYKDFHEANESPLVKEICALCMPGRVRKGLVSVVNYNFDEVLEMSLELKSVDHFVVVSEGDTPSKNELPIFHPHGFLPYKGVLNGKHRNSLVLSEESYHTQFIDPYAWTNITQLNLLRNNVCLFVGLSMTDPNLRRLLEISQQKRPGVRHYAILSNHWKPKPNSENFDIKSKISNVFSGLEEATFNKLGVSVIWVDHHKDTPRILRQIRE